MKTLEEILEKTFYFSSLGSLRNFISWIDNEICMNPEEPLLLQVPAVSVCRSGAGTLLFTLESIADLSEEKAILLIHQRIDLFCTPVRSSLELPS